MMVKRKRKAQNMGGERLVRDEYMVQMGEESKPGKWSHQETISLLEVITHIGEHDVEKVCKIYNSILSNAKLLEVQCTRKETNQVAIKIKHCAERKKLVLLQLEQQLYSFLSKTNV